MFFAKVTSIGADFIGIIIAARSVVGNGGLGRCTGCTVVGSQWMGRGWLVE